MFNLAEIKERTHKLKNTTLLNNTLKICSAFKDLPSRRCDIMCPYNFSAWHELKGFKIKCIHWLTDDDRWFGFSIRSEGAGDIAVNSVHTAVFM